MKPLVTRFCGSCLSHLPLNAFDLTVPPGAPCLVCEPRLATTRRKRTLTKVETLEQRRRDLLAKVVQIDAQILALRGRRGGSRSAG